MKTLTSPHDKGYKTLLSSREIFMQLIHSFIEEPWVKEIDEKNVRRAEKSFISKDFMEKEADLVYEVNLRGKTVVFYILLELQRKVDFSMPYRLLGYMSGIWQNYLALLPEGVEQKSFRLPAVVPIVLYNGSQPWTAAQSFRKMLDEEQQFGRHLLDFEYILIDVNRYTDEVLLALSNTIGAAFLLDKNNRNPKEMRLLLRRLFHSLQNATETEFLIFIRWMRYIIQPRLSSDQQKIFNDELDKLDNKEGLKMVFENLEKSWDAFKDEGRKEGRIEGWKEGKEKGREETKEETALEMLRDNVNINIISKYTKLPIDKIHNLSKKL